MADAAAKGIVRLLIFIENTPRAYAWGSVDALPAILREQPTGEPQAELWLGDHAGAPAMVAKASLEAISLVDLIAGDPAAYGVDGGPLPYLLKVLGIGGPLSIQVHPDRTQAGVGFSREEAEGIPIEDFARSYKDANHKPELIVALSSVRALSGFRPLSEVREDLAALVARAGTCGAAGSQALYALSARLGNGARAAAAGSDPGEATRSDFLAWAFSGDPAVRDTVAALARVFEAGQVFGLSDLRQTVLRELLEAYPADPGVLVSLLMHIVELEPGEALFMPPRQIHAYLSGVGVEVMASSDNVLRAGLTEKHVDAAELRKIVDFGVLEDLRFRPTSARPGLTSWEPPVEDFALHRVTVAREDEYGDVDRPVGATPAETVTLEMPFPAVMLVISGSVRVERVNGRDAGGEGAFEVANVRQGQSLYVSAGAPVALTGDGEAFMATVGATWEAASERGSIIDAELTN